MSLLKATHDYTASQGDELSFRAGNLIAVVRKINDEWTEGRIGSRQGIFPVCFTEISNVAPPKGLSVAPPAISKVGCCDV